MAPYSADRVDALVPPEPDALRARVEGSLSALLSVLELAALPIGVLSICAVTSLSVSQRRPEIGLRRALGFGRLQIGGLIMIECVTLGLLGGLLGMSAGVLVTGVVAAVRQWAPVISPSLVIVAPLAGAGVGAVAGVLPAILAMRVTPLSALRSG
ncbi:MAG TPA: FtsX-like permease family protein [Solirubrobacteraceae bacterium]|nr:FtsX-like permease family protein [Solirubrobacteraceae bacterium]